MAKDVHTEHCCIIHGCKYGDKECTVTTRTQPQSYPCEECGIDRIDPTKGDAETTIYNFQPGNYYKFVGHDPEEEFPTLLYIMGYLSNAENDTCLICDIFMPSDFLTTGKLEFVSSIQGPKLIKRSQWKQISKTEYDAIKKKNKEEYNPASKRISK